ncbi:hypothetical protein RB599_008271 [Gaeumannomyces hyphopodioides]
MGHENKTTKVLGLPLAVVISCFAAMAATQLVTSSVDPWPGPLPDAGACPTVTATATVCSTCLRLDCAVFSTIRSRCGCPAAVPTVTTAFPCGAGNAACAGIGCYTTYRSAAAPPGHHCEGAVLPRRRNVVLGGDAAAATSTTGAAAATVTPASCATVVTVSAFPESCSCDSGFCILDKFVTLPCGCSRLSVATATETLKCPPSESACQHCYTGFPFTETQSCGGAIAAPTPS